jgi:hypothetical protein
MLPASVEGALPTALLPELLPFLKARAVRRGMETHGLECSGWGMLTLAEALVRIARTATSAATSSSTSADTPAGMPADTSADTSADVTADVTETASEDAATFMTSLLVSSGRNSWAGGMLRDAGATMTMEAWAMDEGSGGLFKTVLLFFFSNVSDRLYRNRYRLPRLDRLWTGQVHSKTKLKADRFFEEQAHTRILGLHRLRLSSRGC